jgi:hypothetical protein
MGRVTVRAMMRPFCPYRAPSVVLHLYYSLALWHRASVPEQLAVKPIRRNQAMIDPEFRPAFGASLLIFLLQISESRPHAALIMLFNEPFKCSNS